MLPTPGLLDSFTKTGKEVRSRSRGLGSIPSYNPSMSTLEERMEDFAPSVVVVGDGVEVEVPMDEFMADAEQSEPDEAPV